MCKARESAVSLLLCKDGACVQAQIRTITAVKSVQAPLLCKYLNLRDMSISNDEKSLYQSVLRQSASGRMPRENNDCRVGSGV